MYVYIIIYRFQHNLIYFIRLLFCHPYLYESLNNYGLQIVDKQGR